MQTDVRTWCPRQDNDKLQAGLAVAALLMGDSLDAPRSSVAAKRMERFCSDVSCAAPDRWLPPIPARAFDLGTDGLVCTFEDGSAFHVAPIQGDRGRAWRVCSNLFMGPETTGAATGWGQPDADRAVALSQRLPKARLARAEADWLLPPTPLDLAMPAPARNRPQALVRAREDVLVDLARLVLGPVDIDLVFCDDPASGQVVVGTDMMGIGFLTARTIAIAQEIHGPGLLSALCIVAKRLFPGRLGRCRLPHAHLPEHIAQSFARLRASEWKKPVSAHHRIAALGRLHADHPELVPFLVA
jgi:hypothetical protein